MALNELTQADVERFLKLIDDKPDDELTTLLDTEEAKPLLGRVRADPDTRQAYEARVKRVGARIDTVNIEIPKREHPQHFRDVVQGIDSKCCCSYDSVKEPGVLRIQDPSPKLVGGLVSACDGLPALTRFDVAVDFEPEGNTDESRLVLVDDLARTWDRLTPSGLLPECARFRDSGNWRSGKHGDAVTVTIYNKHEDRGSPLPAHKRRARVELRFQGAGLAYVDFRALVTGECFSFSSLRGFLRFDDTSTDRRVKKALENLSAKWRYV